MRQAVIFDMGNVLIGWAPEQVYAAHLTDAASRTQFFTDLFPRMHNLVHDSQESFSEALAPLREEEPASAPLIDIFERRWHEFLQGPMEPSIAVVRELVDAGVPLYGLTNWPHQTWPPSALDGDHDYGFLSEFEDIVVSGQVQMAKPDSAIYDLALERFSLSADEAVFVDDLAANVATACDLGLHGIQFTDADAMRSEFVRLGLLS